MHLCNVALFMLSIAVASVDAAPVQTLGSSLTVGKRVSLSPFSIGTVKAPAKQSASTAERVVNGAVTSAKGHLQPPSSVAVAGVPATQLATSIADSKGHVSGKLQSGVGNSPSPSIVTAARLPATNIPPAKVQLSAAATATQAQTVQGGSLNNASCPVPAQESFTRSPLKERQASGIEVCGIPFRDDTQVRRNCVANPFIFKFTGGVLSKVREAATTAQQCDHSLELQVLARTLENNGACKAIDTMLNAAGIKSAQKKEEILDPMVNAINGPTNAFFLDTIVNGLKGSTVTAALGGRTALDENEEDTKSPQLRKAVNAYLTDSTILANTDALAKELDALTTKAVENAQGQANLAVACLNAGSARQRKVKEDKVQSISDARKLFDSHTASTTASDANGDANPSTSGESLPITVVSAWNSVKALAGKLAVG